MNSLGEIIQEKAAEPSVSAVARLVEARLRRGRKRFPHTSAGPVVLFLISGYIPDN